MNNQTNNSSSLNARLWNSIALVAGIFAFIISILLILNYLQTNRIDPINTEIINMLVERLNENPDDKFLREQIREMDLLARKAYFTNQWQIRTGGLLLIFCVGLIIISLQLIKINEKAKPEILNVTHESKFLIQKKAQKWISIGGAGIVILALFFAFLSHNQLEHKFEKASLVSQSEPAAFETPEISMVSKLNDSIEIESNHVDQKFSEIAILNQKTTEEENVPEPKINEATEAKYKFPGQAEINANFPAFRGPGGNGTAYQKNIPINWNGETGENILWKVEIPLAGFNSPVIWGNKLFLSGATAVKRELYCFDRNSGKLLWATQIDNIEGSPEKAPEVTIDTGHAAPTLATDGNRIFAIFSNGDIIALDMDGNRIWARNLGVPHNHYGHSSSLMLFEDKLIVQYDHKASASIMALDVRDGNTIWNTKREVKVTWASPIIVNTGNRWEIILIADPTLASYDPNTGKELWSLKCMYGEVGPSVVYSDGIVFAMNEYASLVAIKLGENPEILWEDSEYLSDVPSPVATKDYLIFATSYGVALCYDAKTGTKYWEKEFENGFYSSPIFVDDKIYMLDTKGIMRIFKPEKEFSLIAEPKLGEGTVCTPAFADGRIYIRTDKNLFCIGK